MAGTIRDGCKAAIFTGPFLLAKYHTTRFPRMTSRLFSLFTQHTTHNSSTRFVYNEGEHFSTVAWLYSSRLMSNVCVSLWLRRSTTDFLYKLDILHPCVVAWKMQTASKSIKTLFIKYSISLCEVLSHTVLCITATTTNKKGRLIIGVYLI